MGFWAGGAAVGAGLLANGTSAHAEFGRPGGRLNAGDTAILRFVAAAELIEADLWTQYAELGGIGLRISETLGLQWADVDWLGSKLSVSRGIVNQRVDDVKTEGSARAFDITGDLLDRLKTIRCNSDFRADADWIFASPLQLGRLPYSYTGVCVAIQEAANKAKLGHFGTHTFTHTYRSWLDAVGTTVAVQQKRMRHTAIRTTMNIYGDVVTDEMTTARARVAQLAFQSIGAQAER